MNSGSIYNPTTREAKLFAFMREHIGVRFTACELDGALQPFGRNPCAHTYVASVRVQLDANPSLGYVLPKSKWNKKKQCNEWWLEVRESKPVPSAGQMNLLEAVA